ncbi:glycine cleavage system protein GcvH [Occultella glacieicola]|uniref:Glycine cleavage system H protein n=1 Tax=Occultella glacieicola TaxID=2518684 RepID=A0ABY2DYX7_9MICO|nr:glycine cleavage system protein GcvH [Occultella glacieicola]TDE88946.1 glycine cleavage system protein GcvH [Occultella glacieicola]
MSVPADRQYTAEHEWITVEDGVATVGITAYAADALGDVVYVDLPSVGDSVTAGQTCGEIESTKSVSELYAPVSGEVLSVNAEVVESPELVNSDPYEGGWLFTVRFETEGDLLDSDAYLAITKA